MIVRAGAGEFDQPEDYQQNALENAVRYMFHRAGCGRDARRIVLWGSPGD